MAGGLVAVSAPGRAGRALGGFDRVGEVVEAPGMQRLLQTGVANAAYHDEQSSIGEADDQVGEHRFGGARVGFARRLSSLLGLRSPLPVRQNRVVDG